jgi:hypothetical protein
MEQATAAIAMLGSHEGTTSEARLKAAKKSILINHLIFYDFNSMYAGMWCKDTKPKSFDLR